MSYTHLNYFTNRDEFNAYIEESSSSILFTCFTSISDAECYVRQDWLQPSRPLQGTVKHDTRYKLKSNIAVLGNIHVVIYLHSVIQTPQMMTVMIFQLSMPVDAVMLTAMAKCLVEWEFSGERTIHCKYYESLAEG